MTNIQDIPLFREYIAFVKQEGGCEQCQFPWHDGICECRFGMLNANLAEEMARLAYRFEQTKVVSLTTKTDTDGKLTKEALAKALSAVEETEFNRRFGYNHPHPFVEPPSFVEKPAHRIAELSEPANQEMLRLKETLESLAK